MQYFAVVFVALSHLCSVHAQGNPQPNPNAQPNPTVVVIQPNASAPAVVPAGFIKVSDSSSCQDYGTRWSPEATCTVNRCFGRHIVECNNMAPAELNRNLDSFFKQKLFTESNFRPVYLKVKNSFFNFSQNTFPTTPSGSALSWIQGLEVRDSWILVNLSDILNGMVNMTTLSLTEVSVWNIGKGAFEGLPALREVTIINDVIRLGRIDSGFADPLIANGACLTVSHRADGLPCDCNTIKYVQKSRKSILSNSQLAAGNQPASVGGASQYTNYTCDINILCQSGSLKVNMKDINTDEQCKGDTLVPVFVVATTKDPKRAGNTGAYHGNYPVLLISLFVFLSASFTRYMTC